MHPLTKLAQEARVLQDGPKALDRLQKAIRAAIDAQNELWYAAIDRITRWFWDALMGLLVERLQAMGVQQANVIPAGLLNLLPLHAAWTEDADTSIGRRYALDTLTIAYAPNAGALMTSQEIAGRVAPESVLAVDNPDGSLLFSGQPPMRWVHNRG